MKTIVKFVVFMFICFVWNVPAIAKEKTYSKFLGGIGIGNLNACVSGDCLDESTEPELNTDNGWTFQMVPLAYKTEVAKDIQLAFEPTIFVSHRGFDLEYQEDEYNFKVDGDNTSYGVMGNILARYNLGKMGLVPYIGAGIGYQYVTFDIDASCNGTGTGPGYDECHSFNGQSDPHNDFVRVWTFLAGVETPLLGDLRGNLQYQYMGSDRYRDIAISSQGNSNLNGEHVFSLGLTF